MKIILWMLTLTMIFASCTKVQKELQMARAIELAKNVAKSNNYDYVGKGIEAIKFKHGIEKGPIRANILLHTFSPDEASDLYSRDFWLVYFYPQKATIIGGDYYVLIDLYSGVMIKTKLGK